MKKEILRKKIFDSAWQIVESQGVDKLNVRKIAEMSSCSLGSIYNGFTSFNELQLHINAEILARLYKALDSSIQEGINKSVSLKDILKNLGHTYIEFGLNNRLLWKALFEYFPCESLPDWYVKHTKDGIHFICQKLSSEFELNEEKVKKIVGFFWASIHGVCSILLNRKMEMVADLFNQLSLEPFIDCCLDGIFKEIDDESLLSR